MKIDAIVKAWKEFGRKHDSDILTGGVIVGLITSIYLTYKTTPKINEVLDQHKEMLSNGVEKKEVVKVTVKKIVKASIPVVISVGATIACAIGSNRRANNKIAVLGAAYSLANSTAKDLNHKMNDILGEKKTKEIKDAIAKEKVGTIPKEPEHTGGNSTAMVMGDGLVWCKDLQTGRFFKSNQQKLGEAKNQVCALAMREGYARLNDFYEYLNNPSLPPIPLGNELGWSDNDAMCGDLDIIFSSILSDDGQPCISVTLGGLGPV